MAGLSGELRGRVALVTGVSRRAGIGYAISRRLAGAGASVFLQHYLPHDAGQPWGADSGGIGAVLAGVGAAKADPDAGVRDASVDLAAVGAPEGLIDAVVDAFGRVDVLVCNHARSGGDGALGELDAAMLDAHWAVNTRSSILLTQAFAARCGDWGRVVFMTSGQDLGPMRDEVAYAATKGALASVTRTLADQLADRGITVNAVNPGPVDTGWASAEVYEAVRGRFPGGRWGTPEDVARVIGWLATDDAGWVTGQVINAEGGFRR